MNKYYSGVGSRETPLEIGYIMSQIAYKLAKQNYILRSGGALGADKFFEYGCDAAKGKKEIYRPEKELNGNNIKRNIKEVTEVLKYDHINYNFLKEYTQLLFRRNVNQILGDSLENEYLKSSFCIFWTPILEKRQGGTRIVARIADKYHIPLFNLSDPIIKQKMNNFVKDVNWKPEFKELQKRTKIKTAQIPLI